MIEVICTYIFIGLINGEQYRVPKQIEGTVISLNSGYNQLNQKLWTVKFDMGYIRNKNFRNEFNQQIKIVPENNCLQTNNVDASEIVELYYGGTDLKNVCLTNRFRPCIKKPDLVLFYKVYYDDCYDLYVPKQGDDVYRCVLRRLK